MNYSVNRATHAQVHYFLKENDNAFNPPFSSNIDLNQYAAKLITKATIYELWDAGSLIGIIASYYNPIEKIIFIPYICVSRTGHGAGLFSFFLSQIKGVEAIFLEVRKNNKRAISFYEKFDFHVVSQSEDKFLLKKEL